MNGFKSILAIIAIVFLSSSIIVSAQTKSTRSNLTKQMKEIKKKNSSKSFQEYTEQAKKDYESTSAAMKKRYAEFRDSVMKDYIAALDKQWENGDAKKAAPKPEDNSIGPDVLDDTPNKDVAPTPNEEPAPKQEPIAEPTPAVDPEPAVEPAPTVEPTPIEEPTPVVDPQPVIEPEPTVEPTPKLEPMPRRKPAPEISPIGKIPVKDIVELPTIDDIVQPEPFVPVVVPEDVVVPETFKFTFFGTTAGISIDDDCRFKLASNTNHGVAKAITEITENDKYSIVLQECLKLRSDYKLCDWAYLQALTKLSDSFFGEGTNESTLLTGYLFCMSGYKLRYAFDTAEKLYILVACDQYITDIPYISLPSDNYCRYFVINAPKSGGDFYVCDYPMPDEKAMSLYIVDEPMFDNAENGLNLKLHSYPSINFDYKINKNLIDFYNTYPTPFTEGDSYSKWTYYAKAPMSQDAKETVYPAIRKAIEGKTEVQAVNIIMDMIETFEYGYDDKIWGYDRAFFPDETLYYPKSDCEDHAILLSRMVRDLLGLPTALIYYPGHLAAAVCFSESPSTGDYIMHNGQKYTVCDPTIYYAGVGRTMRGMNNSEAILIVIR